MIFVDTGFFFALVSSRDPDHERVLEVLASFGNRRLRDFLITTNHVVFETIRLTRRRIGHGEAVSMGELLYSEKMARVHWASREEEEAAFAYLKKYRDKEYSPLDCLSFVVMERLNIGEALSLNSDFTHRFIARPGPLNPQSE